eukprot:4733987-Heterocapsa_arctica.AAC.1
MGSSTIPYPTPLPQWWEFDPEDARDWLRDLLRSDAPLTLHALLKKVVVCRNKGVQALDGSAADSYDGLH